MSRACRFSILCMFIVAAVASTAETRAGIVVSGDSYRGFTWGSNRTYGTGDTVQTLSSYTRTVDGITQASTPISDSGFTMTTTGSTPKAGQQWTQHVSVSFLFTEDTTLTLSGTLFSQTPIPADSFGNQYVTLSQGSTELFGLTAGETLLVPGPQAYSYTTTLSANTPYSIEANTSWANAVNGETQTFMTFSTVAVPEPSTCAMALAGLACGAYAMFRRRRSRWPAEPDRPCIPMC